MKRPQRPPFDAKAVVDPRDIAGQRHGSRPSDSLNPRNHCDLGRGPCLAPTEVMIRITVVPREHGATRVIVEGRITKVSSVELAGVCDQHLAVGDHLELDLSAVTFADSDGVTLIRDLVRQGCVLGECAGLVRALVSDDSPQLPRSTAATDEAAVARAVARRRRGRLRAGGTTIRRPYAGDRPQIS